MKKFMLVLLAMLVLICSIGMVSANDNVDDLALGDSNAGDSFNDLNTTIQAAIGAGNYSYELDKNYTWQNGDQVITLTVNNFVIDGKNFTINGNNKQGSVFKLNGCVNITIKNINFVNCKQVLLISKNMNNDNMTLDNCSIKNSGGSKISVIADGGSGIGKLTVKYCNFEGNERTHSGNAAVINYDGQILEVLYCNFTNNTAADNGGAIGLYLGNSAKSNTKAIISYCNFDGNKALGTSVDSGIGGAIRAIIVDDLTITSCNFTNNSANYGGAIGLNLQAYADVKKSVKITDCKFEENEAKSTGGAISINSYDQSVIDQTYVISGCEFTNNTAPNGGVLGITRIQDRDSKAAIINITFSDCDFSLNEANHNGTVIYIPSLSERAETKITLTIDSSNFDENSITDDLKASGSGYGSAIYNFKANLTVTNSKFTNNKATQGTIYHKTSKFLVVDNCTFDDNYAYGSGSAIYVGLYNSTIAGNNNVTITNSVFSNNNATGDLVSGILAKAAVNILQANKTIIENCTFLNNTAGDAAALYFGRTPTVIVNNSIFVSNYAIAGYGGAIGISSGDNKYNRKITIISSSFANNTAKTKGGAIYAAMNATLNISYCVFDNNRAEVNALGNNAIYLNNESGWINLIGVDYCFWGDNYKLADFSTNQFIILNDDEGANVIAPKFWVLYNIIQPEFIKVNQNNTFSLVFNQYTDGKTINSFNKNMSKFLVGLKVTGDVVVPDTTLISGKFNLTSTVAGKYTITIFNYFTNDTLKTINIDVNYKSLTDLKKLVDATGSSLVLAEDYAYLHGEDNKLIQGVLINKNMTIDGAGFTVDGLGYSTIFHVASKVKLTLKNIKLVNSNAAVLNDGILSLTNVTGNGLIVNRGIITSAVKFNVLSDEVATYGSFVSSLRTADGMAVVVPSLKFSDDQGNVYTGNFVKGIAISYMPAGISGDLTFNNVTIKGFNNLTSSGDLHVDAASNKKSAPLKTVANKVVSNVKVVKNTVTKVVNTLLTNALNLFVSKLSLFR